MEILISDDKREKSERKKEKRIERKKREERERDGVYDSLRCDD